MSKEIGRDVQALQERFAKFEAEQQQRVAKLEAELQQLRAATLGAPDNNGQPANITAVFLESNATMKQMLQSQTDDRNIESATKFVTTILAPALVKAKLPGNEEDVRSIVDPIARAKAMQDVWNLVLPLIRAQPGSNVAFIRAVLQALFPLTVDAAKPAAVDFELRSATATSSGCPKAFFSIAVALNAASRTLVTLTPPSTGETPTQYMRRVVFLIETIEHATGKASDFAEAIRDTFTPLLFQGKPEMSRKFAKLTTIADIYAFINERPELQLHSSTSTASKPNNNSTGTTATGNVRSTRAARRAKKAQQQSGTATVAATSSGSSSTNEAPDEEYALLAALTRERSTPRCVIDVVATSGDSSGIQLQTACAVDTMATASAISTATVTKLKLRTRPHITKLYDATKRQIGISTHVADIIVRTATDSAPVLLRNALVVDRLQWGVLIGDPDLDKLRARICYGTSFVVQLDPDDDNATTATPTTKASATVAATTTTSTTAAATSTAHKYATATDELMAGIDFTAIKATPRFISDVRFQAQRLDSKGLLIGTNAPGPQLPQAIRGDEHKLELKPGTDASQIFGPWHHLPPDKYAALQDKIQSLLAAGIVERMYGPGATQIVPLVIPRRDSDGKITGYRVVVDARPANAVIQPQRFDTPSIRVITQFMSEARVMSKVDLKDFYMQFPLAPASSDLIRMRVSDNSYVRWTRMPPGLCTAQATAQAFVDRHFCWRGEQMAYLDDIAARHMKTDSQGNIDLNDLLRWWTKFVDTCIEHNVTINATKTKLFTRSATILGHAVSHNKIEPIQSRLDALLQLTAPHNKGQLRRIVAMFQWYQPCAANLSQHLAPLTAMTSTSPSVAFEWTARQQAAFDRCKAAIHQYATLSSPLTNVPFIVSTDASGDGLGFVIEQRDPTSGDLKIVALGGRKFTKAELNYSIPDKEMCAMRHVLKVHGEWLLPSSNTHRITWRTDSQTIAHYSTMSLEFKSPAMKRFVIEMQALPIDPVLVRSEENPVADAVSRQRVHLAAAGHTATIATLTTEDDSDDDDDTVVLDISNDSNDDSDDDEPLASNANVAAAAPSTPPHVSATSAPTSPPRAYGNQPPPPRAQPTHATPSASARALPPTPPTEVPVGAHVTLATPVSAPASTATTTSIASPASSPIASDSTTSTSTSIATAALQPPAAPPTVAAAPLTATAPIVDAFIALAAPSVDPAKATMIAAQRADTTLAIYFAAAEGQTVPSHVAALRPCVDGDGLLMVRARSDMSQTVVVVPKSHIAQYCTAAHGGANGHNGKKSSLWTSLQTAWWPTQSRDITEHCDKCLQCQSQRRVLPNALMGRPPTALRRFQLVQMDCMPMPLASDGHNCVYLLTDVATGFTIGMPARDKTADSALAAANTFIGQWDTPETLKTDMGAEFISGSFRAWAEREGIKLMIGSAYNHQSSGVVESAVGRLKRQLLHFCQSGNAKYTVAQWPLALPAALRAINRAFSSSRGTSAHALVFGALPHDPITRKIGIETSNESTVPTGKKSVTFAADLGARVSSAVAAANNIRAHRQDANANYQQKHGSVRDIAVGDYVFIFNNGETQPTAVQNIQTQSGPYRVKSIDATTRQAVLVRPADNTQLATPVTLNRLQYVDAEAVTTARTPTGEPGEMAWTGVTDTRLLLDSEKTAVAKSLGKQADAERAQRAQADAAAARDTQRRAYDAKLHAEQQRAAAAHAAAELERQQRRARIVDRHASTPIPVGAVPFSILHTAEGMLLVLTTDINDRSNNSKLTYINAKHPRYAEMKTAYDRGAALQQRSARERQLRRRQ
jgi:hypothetical protein